MPVRLQILLILRNGERSVTALMEELSPRMPQPTVSHHLGLLRAAGLVRPRRAGKHMLYSLQEPTVTAGADGAGVIVAVGNYHVHFTVPNRQAANQRPN